MRRSKEAHNEGTAGVGEGVVAELSSGVKEVSEESSKADELQGSGQFFCTYTHARFYCRLDPA